MKIAIIGSGISGLGAAYILSRQHEVTLFEAESRFGGHSNTIDVSLENKTFPVDTGFLVHNDWTYPHLVKLFKELSIPVHPSDMSLSVKIDNIDLEWAGSSLGTLFSQKKNLLRPGFWRMIIDILKINRNKHKYIHQYSEDVSLEQFFLQESFSKEFIEWYFLPMGASIWSTPSAEMLKYPAKTILQFCLNHGLLQVFDRPQWKTVVGGSRVYVKKIVDGLKDARANCPVRSVTRENGQVKIESASGTEIFDKVIFATHAPITMKLAKDLSAREAEILSSFKYADSPAYVHTDISHLPKNRDAWSSWNFSSESSNVSHAGVAVTYLINMLQPLPAQTPVLVTLNPNKAIASDKIIRTIQYSHPLFDTKTVAAQKQLDQIQGVQGYFYAGAWTRYGFHEDGLLSAVLVCSKLGMKPSWETS